MKSATLFLSLIACGQNPEDSLIRPAPASVDSHTTITNTPGISKVDPEAVTTSGQVEGPRFDDENQDPPSGEPILVCASSAGSGNFFTPSEIDPEILYSVSRISVFADGDSHAVKVERGAAYDPETVFGSAVYHDAYFNLDEHSVDISWDGSSITGWRTPEYGPIFTGGGWGNIAAPIFNLGEPPPPCGFEIYMSCWEPNKTEAPFQYNSKTGQCINADNEEGLNYKPVEYVRETGDGECAELSWASLSEYVGFDVELKDWNLRGAKLESAHLGLVNAAEGQSAHHSLVNARLEGTDLSDLLAVDATIIGTIDEHTQLPDMDCITENNAIVDCEI